jgi:hypothetical protein
MEESALISITSLSGLKPTDDDLQISCIKIQTSLLVLGTNSGFIRIFDIKSNTHVGQYQAHKKRVSDLWLQR